MRDIVNCHCVLLQLKYFSVKTKETNQTTSESQTQHVVEIVTVAEPASEELVEAVICAESGKTNTETETGKRKHPDDCSTKIKESKHAASFKESWGKRRHWLVFMRGKGLFCQSCQRHDMKPFGRDTWKKQPCKRLRLQSVTDHDRPIAHKTALEMYYEATQHADVAVAIVSRVSMPDMAKTCIILPLLLGQATDCPHNKFKSNVRFAGVPTSNPESK